MGLTQQFSDFKKEIRDDNAVLSNIVAKSLATIEEQHKHLTMRIAEHNEEIYGNGDPGLKTEVDRLKQAETRRSNLGFALASSIILLVVSATGAVMIWIIRMMK